MSILTENPLIKSHLGLSVRDDLYNTAIIKIYIPKSLSFLQTSVRLFLLALGLIGLMGVTVRM